MTTTHFSKTTFSDYPSSNPEHHTDLEGSFYNRREAVEAARLLIWGTTKVRDITANNGEGKNGALGYFQGCPTFTAKITGRTRQFRLDNYGRLIEDNAAWIEVQV